MTGTVVIDEGATVTISGSEKAVGSSITYDGTLYGSADENGAAGDTVEFRDGTCYVGDAVAKRISTEKETPAITLEKLAQPENLTVVYHDKYSSKLSLDVTFDGTVDADHPATINYYVDGATESFPFCQLDLQPEFYFSGCCFDPAFCRTAYHLCYCPISGLHSQKPDLYRHRGAVWYIV